MNILIINLYVLIRENKAYTALKRCGIYSNKKICMYSMAKKYTHDQKMIYTPSQNIWYILQPTIYGISITSSQGSGIYFIPKMWYMCAPSRNSIYFIKISIYV